MFKKNVNVIEQSQQWKEKNKEYLKELQNFFDKADNILDIELKRKIIGQMLKCDEVLTKIAESRFEEYYKLGYKNAKRNKKIFYVHNKFKWECVQWKNFL